MTVSRRGTGFQAAFMVDGSRFRAQFPTLLEAETWEDEVRLALKKGQPTPAPTGSTGGASPGGASASKYATLGACLDYTIEHTWNGKRSEIDLVRKARAVVEHFGRNKLVREINKLELDTLVLALKRGNNASGTINRKLAALSVVLKTAVGLGEIVARPDMPRQKEPEGRLRWCSREEVIAIASTLRLWSLDAQADAVIVLADTGLRVGELLSLDWSEVTAQRITVLAAKAKGKRSRDVPLTERVQSIMLQRRATETGGPFRGLTYPSLRHYFEKAVGHLGLRDVVIHTLRHTTASWLVMGGVDLLRVMKLMGHASIQTTQRYAHLSPKAFDGLADVIAGTSSNVVQLNREVA